MTASKERFVVYVDIPHQMPSSRTETLLDEVREKWVMEAKLKGDDAWWYFVAVRSGGDGTATRVERL